MKLSIQDFVVKNDQIHQLKFASYQKMLLYDLDFLGLEKFCLDYEILYEYIFAEIKFKIYGTNYFEHKLMIKFDRKNLRRMQFNEKIIK